MLRLADQVMDGSLGEVGIITPPTVGMVMIRALDSAQGEIFNFGEALVTEARVRVGDHEGWGLVMGASPDRALGVAIVDAALEAGHASRAAVEMRLAALHAELDAEESAARSKLAATRVQFDNF